jgi:excinuclease ABC subunit A
MPAGSEPPAESTAQIWLRGVRTQNLKGIDVAFPINILVAVTGVSGAGKTSLAVSTLAAEGQRRFIETFPAAARRFLERLERPDCDQIGPLPPAIIHRHHHRSPGKRSTVATLSEVSATLQQLYSSTGQIFCPKCDIPVAAYSAVSVAEFINQLPAGLRIQLGFRMQLDLATIPDKSAADLLESGFQRSIINGHTLTLKFPLPSDWPQASEWDIVVDRLQTGRISSERLVDSLEISMQRGGGSCLALLHGPKHSFPHLNADEFELDGEQVVRLSFHTRPICSQCQTEFSPLSPQQFSFNSPVGACPKCRGFGSNKNALCLECHGNRLRPEPLSARCGPWSFGAVLALTIREAVELGSRWPELISESLRQFAGPQLAQLQKRLEMLNRLGLGHLTLNRSAQTLSTGEIQRLSLAATCAVELVNSLYVLEEPASGLHPRDIRKLIDVLYQLKQRRNTVVFTEHVGEIIQAADFVIDLGPGAGPEGGQLIYDGSPEGLQGLAKSTTGEYLGGLKTVKSPQPRTSSSWLKLSGVQFRNLNGINVEFPLGTLCAVTGISGSGKSSLIRDTLYPALLSCLNQTGDVPERGGYVDLTGFETLHSVVFVDQSVLEKSSRGNVATASGIWPEIRGLLSDTPEAKLRQFTAGTFSFYSSSGGRCPHCEGRGTVAVDLQFLADVTITCPECVGMRFQRDILEVKYRGHHVAEILNLTIRDALPFFRGKSRLQRRLKAMKDVGLGFLQLGQPIMSLSGGETQRLKLAARMMAKPSGATLFLLDEPARGLHPADIQALVNWFHDLLNEGHSFIVIEHRQELVRVADHVIELGPGAGPDGGRIVFHSKVSPMA